MPKKPKRSKKKKSRKQPRQPNLGQKEAEQQQRSDSELSHMGNASRSNKRTANRLRKSERYDES
jgi:hypothetical protein